MRLLIVLKPTTRFTLIIGLVLFAFGVSTHIFDTYIFRESLFLGYGILHMGALFFLSQKILARKSNHLPIGRYIIAAMLVCLISIAQYVLFMLVITGVSR